MLKAIKKTTVRVYTKANKIVTLHEDLTTLFTIIKGQSESNDGYPDRFNSNAQTVEMAGGQYAFFRYI